MEHLYDLGGIQCHGSIPMSARPSTAYFSMPRHVASLLAQGQGLKQPLYDAPQARASARSIGHHRVACLRPLSRYARVLPASFA